MMQAHGIASDAFEPFFLGHKWIQNSIFEYRRGNNTFRMLKGKAVIFPEKHFAAAFMHLYVGTFSLAEIADMVSVTRAELTFLRTQIDFMTLVDNLKVSFTKYFREKLILNEYRPGEYASIAAEYATFEELVRNQIRFPLFRRMEALATSISDKVEFDISVDLYHLQTFKKLYSFFVFEESFLPALSRPSFQHLERIAKEIVWKKLRADYDEIDSLLCLDVPRKGVKDSLGKIFAFLKPQKADL